MDDEHEVVPEGPAIPPGYRLHNGVLVPAEQPAITRIMAKEKAKRDPRRRWVLGGALLLVLVIVVVALSVKHPAKSDVTVAPAAEKTFLEKVRNAQNRVLHGNAVTLVSARDERETALCKLLKKRGGQVQGWVGVIHDIDTDSGDDGIITVSIGDGTDLRTGSGSGAEKRTLLQPRSTIFESVARLHDGDRVVLDGRFVGHQASCLTETSIRARNSVLTPDFLFLFSSIRRA